MLDSNRGLSFGQVADEYDRIRPTYPPESVEWAIGRAPRRVLDLGAGTGILTRLVDALGHDVVAVEPDEKMLAQLASASPALHALAGTADAIPLSDASVDAVVVGQAYHWFSTDTAHTEIARVLRPKGIFAPMWNARDESVPWVAELTEISGLHHDGSSGIVDLVHSFGPLFGAPAHAAFSHSVMMTPDSLLALVRSRSYYLVSTPAEQARVDAAVQELVAGHQDLAGREQFELPYATHVFKAQLL